MLKWAGITADRDYDKLENAREVSSKKKKKNAREVNETKPI